jgi:hypothetical protein
MRYTHPLATAPVGRNLQHLEDLVFVDGSAGAHNALDVLVRLGTDVSDVSVKWDGTPAVMFGRDEAGTFILTDLAGFKAKGYNGKVKSARDFEVMLLNRGKEINNHRRRFASSMAEIWSAFENATPPNLRGFIHGDLLYTDTPTLKSGHYVFTPNKVTYTVTEQSDIGQRIGRSTAGVVIHTFTSLDGDKRKASLDMVKSGELFVMPPVIMQQPPQTDVTGIDRLRSQITQNTQLIDNLVAPQPGLSDIRNIIYTYVNQMSRAKRWDELTTGFGDWLAASKISKHKQVKILNSPEFKQYNMLFDLVLKIQAMKNSTIEQFDNSKMNVESSIGDERGGEGYVAMRDKVKLVPRHKWTLG